MIEEKGKKADWKRKLFLEMTAYWINVAYLTLLFAVFTSYRRLILANYDITYSNWGISFIKAMVLAKVVMVGGLFHFGRALEKKPLGPVEEGLLLEQESRSVTGGKAAASPH
jgi:hypothetical protein